MREPIVQRSNDFDWVNFHRTSGVGGRVRCLFKPRNRYDDNTQSDPVWRAGLEGLIGIVQKAERDGMRLRAAGSTWSLSSAAFVEDYMVDTSALSEWTLGFSSSMVEGAFAGVRNRLVFAQCGVQIRVLNGHLEPRRLCLPTQGASNGQTIVGAMSTGTHGSAREVGSVQDYVLGLHIVAEGGRHFWVERASRPVMTQAFVDFLGASLVRNDEIFNAAVVSFGSFGLIHAVVFAAEPVFVLDKFVRQMDFDDVWPAATTLDMSAIQLPFAAPFHFEIGINPYRRAPGQKGAFVRAYYKTTLDPNDPLPTVPVGQESIIRSPDLVNVLSFLSDAAPVAVPGKLQSQLEKSYPTSGNPLPRGLPGQIFDDTLPTNGGTSVEIGVNVSDAAKTLQAIFEVTSNHVFGAAVALRYVKASNATLAFTCHAPTTCTIELPGIDSHSARAAHQLIFDRLWASGIAVTYHWGQQGRFDHASLVRGYGSARLDLWVQARRAFLTTAPGRRMFSSPMLDAAGLVG